MTYELTHIDLFSGIGGFSLAAEWAGFRTVAFSEIHQDRCRDLARLWPRVPNLGDVRTGIDWSQFRGATVLTGGFPCQPWSETGKRLGKDDPRHLWPAMFHAISQTRPAWVVGENVAGIIGLEFEEMLLDLEREGYAVQPVVIPACAVGAIHERERVWILANDTKRVGKVGHSIGKKPKQPPYNNGHHAALWLADEFPNSPEDCLCDRDDGLSAQPSEIEGLGNAIVPQVAYQILKGIAEIERQ